MSLEGNEWVDDVQEWLLKKKTQNHFSAEQLFLASLASSHAPPRAPGDRAVFVGFGNHHGGFIAGCAPPNCLRLRLSFALKLFFLVLKDWFNAVPNMQTFRQRNQPTPRSLLMLPWGSRVALAPGLLVPWVADECLVTQAPGGHTGD